MDFKIFTGENPDVFKYVFEFDNIVTEAVLYKYPTFEKRTVLCISVQSGCPVGCTFCGTGNKFLKSLSADEIVEQVTTVLNDKNINVDNIEKFQIMFMSMGEPFLNYFNVKCAIERLNRLYPNAQLLISTIAPDEPKYLLDFILLSQRIPQIGLQFSIHKSNDRDRNKLIPYKNKLSLLEIRNYGVEWWHRTNRRPYLNYCVDGKNTSETDIDDMIMMFPKNVFNFTFSVVCSNDETMKDAGYRNLKELKRFESIFLEEGYNTRIFDPAGQDDIGGGCGQLWYVQNKLKNK